MSNEKLTLPFPNVSKEPEDEYHGLPIFSNAFPWLFPGGIGDINYNKKKENGYVQKWVKAMVYYHDGRFVKDPTWCFYALNYMQRHQNNVSGGFFIRDFITSNKPSSLDALKEQISRKDYTFVEKLIYFSSKIRGSDSYWRLKKSQLYTWVYWHIEQGHGPPTLFITLSCAEYYWPDVKKLLKDRIKNSFDTSDNNYDDMLTTKAAIMKAVNQYSIVIQEYFTLKVKDWIETYAAQVLQVKHWFVRFEFAKGRGEIHAHILAIADNMNVYIKAHEAPTTTEKTEILASYAQNVLGLTSKIATNQDECRKQTKDRFGSDNPATLSFCSVTDIDKDKLQLCLSCQTHKCGDYCMKYNTKNKSKKQRYCRAGCGYETKEGACDTPGFDMHQDNLIKKDDKGTCRLLLERNNPRMIQTSMKVLQSWRSNCDVQLIIYESDPKNPDLSELAKVTDYVVSYACKGNCTHDAEKQALLDVILK